MGKKYWTHACPLVSPDEYEFMCRKPIGHYGVCEAAFCQGPPQPFKGKVVPTVLMPITITEQEARRFGIDTSKLEVVDE